MTDQEAFWTELQQRAETVSSDKDVDALVNWAMSEGWGEFDARSLVQVALAEAQGIDQDKVSI